MLNHLVPRLAVLFATLCLVAISSALAAGETAVTTSTTSVSAPADVGVVVPDVANDRREALRLLQEAELELENGSRNRALESAKKAQALYPESRSIAALLRQLRADRQVRTEMSAQLRAKARLAAALTRSNHLIEQRRYSDAADLLDGVRDAVELFPEGTRVTLFRQQAERYADSARYALAVRSLGSQADTVTGDETPSEEQATASRPLPVAPPRNIERLVAADGRVPTWYRQLKASLAVEMNVEYAGMPLGHVLHEVQSATGVRVIVDEAVRKAGLPVQALIDLRINGVSAETVLALATEISGTEYVLFEDRIVISTRDKAIAFVDALPGVLADRWIAMHVLFPEQFDAELARAEGTSPIERETEAAQLPPYLRSGESLLAEVQRLLR